MRIGTNGAWWHDGRSPPSRGDARPDCAQLWGGHEQLGGRAETAYQGATVGKWRERFREFGVDGLPMRPRAGAPRKITISKLRMWSPRPWNPCRPTAPIGARV